jgi:hypothetical protein
VARHHHAGVGYRRSPRVPSRRCAGTPGTASADRCHRMPVPPPGASDLEPVVVRDKASLRNSWISKLSWAVGAGRREQEKVLAEPGGPEPDYPDSLSAVTRRARSSHLAERTAACRRDDGLRGKRRPPDTQLSR